MNRNIEVRRHITHFLLIFAAIIIFTTRSQSIISYSVSGTYSWVVPVGVTSISVTLQGASGCNCAPGIAGYGGIVSATLSTTPGSTLTIYVGGEGTETAGGFNGGAAGGSIAGGCSSGGGGATDIRTVDSLSNRVIVAGGGGGVYGTCSSNGGNGGYPSGGSASGYSGCSFSFSSFAGGGSQTSGGVAGVSAPSGSPGTFGSGGAGDVYFSGGGGGGYYGGGGGGAGSAGGGGSSYCDGVICTNPTYSTASTFGDGSVTIQYTLPPTFEPTNMPVIPSVIPTCIPSFRPTLTPTTIPTLSPTCSPSTSPTPGPSKSPTFKPSKLPTSQPSTSPSEQPSKQPMKKPSKQPSTQPAVHPSKHPSLQPSEQPLSHPSQVPTHQPSSHPSARPSKQPSRQPSVQPIIRPSEQPSKQPSTQPSKQPNSWPSEIPSLQPSTQPSLQPLQRQPSKEPSSQPSKRPLGHPSSIPSRQSSSQPTYQPSRQPVNKKPSAQPTLQPTRSPSNRPSNQPFSKPSLQPATQPSRQPSAQPFRHPSMIPSKQPSTQPHYSQPSGRPSSLPSLQPFRLPSVSPSRKPSCKPTEQPFAQPTLQPLRKPSHQPSKQPSSQPSRQPSSQPSLQPSWQPIINPSHQPSKQPSRKPSKQLIIQPSIQPSLQPMRIPSIKPSQQPFSRPSMPPSSLPSNYPSLQPLWLPTTHPSKRPTCQPTEQPILRPTLQPFRQPSCQPTKQPSSKPFRQPSSEPSSQPSSQPFDKPSFKPSKQPSMRPSSQSFASPSFSPSKQPFTKPSRHPLALPSINPTTKPVKHPSMVPTKLPSSHPSTQPYYSQPSSQPSSLPSKKPSLQPLPLPSVRPSRKPSCKPTEQPTAPPTLQPFRQPSCQPSKQPSSQPFRQPSSQPSLQPSSQPFIFPSHQPSKQPFKKPSRQPSITPSIQPSLQPMKIPSDNPSQQPFSKPSMRPSSLPSYIPSQQPLWLPSSLPSERPSCHPTKQPLALPTLQPFRQPSCQPSKQPSSKPFKQPSSEPSSQSSSQPFDKPSFKPSKQPSMRPSSQSFASPSFSPSKQPFTKPSRRPLALPSFNPTAKPVKHPSMVPTKLPSSHPSTQPYYSQPSSQPSSLPSKKPSLQPLPLPSVRPSRKPSCKPTEQPTAPPTLQPFRQPSCQPSKQPSSLPSNYPSSQSHRLPSAHPSKKPSCNPTKRPFIPPTLQPLRQPPYQPLPLPSLSNSRSDSISIQSSSDVSHFNVHEELVLTATVFSIELCETNWTLTKPLNTFNLSNVAVFNGVQLVQARQVSFVSLILKSGSLLLNGIYNFEARCGYLSSSIMVLPNRPPQDGYLKVTPPVGTELSTYFHLAAQNWKDDNIPLTYQFGYVTNWNYIIQYQSPVNYSASYLPADTVSGISSLNCSVQVYDIYQASTESTKTIQVYPLKSDQVQSLINSTLLSSSPLTLQRINLISSLLSKVNCTNSPSCRELFRSDCSLVDHTCGPCLSGYIGETGYHNSVCFLYSDSNSSIPMTETKQCPNNCSSRGNCVYSNVYSGAKVQNCWTFSVDCNAHCICYTGFMGSACSYTTSELNSLQGLVDKALLGLFSLSSISLRSSSQISALATSLAALTANSDQLSPASANLVLNIANVLLSSMLQLNTNYQIAASTVVQAVDSAVSVGTVSPQLLISTLKLYGSLVTSQLYPGQSSVDNIKSNFRLVSSVIYSSPRVSLPLSVLETVSGKQASSVDATDLLSAQPSYKINIIEPQSILFNESKTFNSNPLIISVSHQQSEGSMRYITVRLVHSRPQYFPNSTNNITTVCKRRMPSLIFHYNCPISGYVIVHNCTNRIGTLTSQCPMYQAQCSHLSNASKHHLCTEIHFSSEETICNCTVVIESLSSLRRLDSSSIGGTVASTSLEVVATAALVAESFAETFQAAPNLTTTSEIGSVTLIIVLYSSLWFAGMFILIFSTKYTKVAIDKTDNNGSNMKENLKAYVAEAIPTIFSSSGPSFRVLRELLKHHKYASLFYSKRIPKSRIVGLITLLSLLMFLVAFFDDLQSPSDDGTCENFQSSSTCLARKTPFDSTQSYCKWNIVSDDGATPGSNDYCSFHDSESTVQELLTISVIISLFTAVFLRPIEYLLDLLQAPTASSLASKIATSLGKSGEGVRTGASVREISEDTVRARNVARKSLYGSVKMTSIGNKDILLHVELKNEEKNSFGGQFDYPNGTISTGIETFKAICTQELKRNIFHQRFLLKSIELNEFDRQWGLLSSTPEPLNHHHTHQTSIAFLTIDFRPTIFEKISHDLETVHQLTTRRVQKLKMLDSEQAGLEILHLFIIDLLGRDSPAAKIFESKLEEDFKETKVVRWAWKVAAGVILALLNILFPYYTMLYGSVRGMAWQWTFLSTCIAQIFIEIFINETLECLWLNYFVPLLASREVTAAHQVLLDLVDKVGESGRADDNRLVLNAPDYLFVSKRVAKAFPSLMESSIIELYKTYLPGESGKLWHESHLKRAFDRAMANVTRGSSVMRYAAMMVFVVLVVLEYCATVPYLLQRMAVRFFQPFFVSGIILLFYIVIDSPIFTAIFFISVAGVIAVLFRKYLFDILWRRCTKHSVAPITNPLKEDFLPVENSSSSDEESSWDSVSLSVCSEVAEIEWSLGSSSLGSSIMISLPSSASGNSIKKESSDEEYSSSDDES